MGRWFRRHFRNPRLHQKDPHENGRTSGRENSVEAQINLKESAQKRADPKPDNTHGAVDTHRAAAGMQYHDRNRSRLADTNLKRG
jgi:hypothetical protein